VAVVVISTSLVGLLLDRFTGAGLGWLFGAFFVAGSVYAALQVRPADLPWGAIVPPLAFALLVVPHGFLTTSGSFLTKLVDGLNDLLDYGPMLWLGTGLAVAIVVVRAWRGRSARRP
jgi:hypothetical protein